MKLNKVLILSFLFSFGLVTTSCVDKGEKEDTSHDEQYTKDIVGRWRKASEETSQSDKYLYYVYQADGWGYTWDEGDDVSEQEVINEYPGNGWFEWEIYNARVVEKHKFTSSSAVTTKRYKITQLTDTRLVKYDETGEKERIFTRVN